MTLSNKKSIEKYLSDVSIVIAILIAVSMPFAPAIYSVLVIAFSSIVLLNIIIRKTIFNRYLSFAFLLLFLVYVLSTILSDDKMLAVNSLQTKTALLLPIFLLQLKLNEKNIEAVLNIVVILTIFLCLLCFINSAIIVEWNILDALFKDKFLYRNEFTRQTYPIVVNIHPVYFSMFIIFSSLVLINKLLSTKNRKVFYYLSIVVILVFFYFNLIILASRTAVAIYFFTVIVILLSSKRLSKIFKIVTFASLIGIILISLNHPQIKYRFTNSIEKDLNHKYKNWKAAVDIFKDNPILGTGLGDVQGELSQNYKKLGYKYGLERNLNAHNEYLQILSSVGLAGFLIFLFIALTTLKSIIVKKDILFGGFSILIYASLLTESMLSRQLGIGFILFFLSILYLRNQKLNKVNNGEK